MLYQLHIVFTCMLVDYIKTRDLVHQPGSPAHKPMIASVDRKPQTAHNATEITAQVRTRGPQRLRLCTTSILLAVGGGNAGPTASASCLIYGSDDACTECKR